MTRRPAPSPEDLAEAERLAEAAAELTPQIEDHERTRLDLARARRDLWRRSHELGLSYAKIGAKSGVHASQVEKALKRPMETTRPSVSAVA